MNYDTIIHMSESQYEVFEKMLESLERRNSEEIADAFVADWKNDAELDQLILMSKLEQLSLISNKWAKRRFDQVQYISKLKRTRQTVFEKLKKIKQHSGDILDKARFKDLPEDSKSWSYALKKEKPLVRIDRQIEEHQNLLEFIEHILGDSKWNLRSSMDNIVALKKVETLN